MSTLYCKKTKSILSAFTLAEVLIAKRESGKMSLLNLCRMRELKVPSSRFLKQCAFTLAEVLITLGIIGVVAAMTIPILINNNQKAQELTGLKKFYTQFNQALITLANDYDCPSDLECTGVFTNSTTNAGDILVKYFKVIKNCQLAHDAGCMPNKSNDNYDGSGAVINNDANDWGYRFIMADGFAVNFSSSGNGCAANNISSGVTKNLTQTCGGVAVDINGPTKGPNYYGRDLFFFIISNGKGPLLYPRGGSDDAGAGWWQADGCGGNGNKWAKKCAARIIEENWQMNY